MPTENRRVATYLPKHIDDRLEAFKTERGLKGDSPALIAILEDFFEVSCEVAHIGSIPLGQRVDALESKVDDLVNVSTQRFQELSEKMESTQIEIIVLHELRISSLSELKSELMNTLFLSNAQLKSEILSELRGEPQEANSLNLPPGQLSFLEPESELLDESGSEHPEPDLPLSSDSEVNQRLRSNELLGEPDSELQSVNESGSWSELKGDLPPMTETALAERFRLGNPRSLANRRGKVKDNFQDFIKWSISKDPEDKAWLYDSSIKLYYRVAQDSSSESEDF